MLNTLRNQSGSLWAKLLLILLVLSFGVWGVGDMLRASGRNAPVAVVGGTDISRVELARAIEQESEAIRQMMGQNYSPEMLKTLGVANQALEKLINLRLLEIEAHRIGLLPSDDDVAEYIRQMPPFLDQQGKFSKDRVRAILSNKGISEAQLAADVRQQLGTNVLTGIFSLISPAPQAAAKHLHNILQESRTADLLVLPASSVKEIPAADEEVLKAYHQQHAGQFVAPELRSLSYIVLKTAEIGKANPPSEDDIKAAYEERRAEFQQPETRNVAQLIFGSEELAKKAAELIKSGTKFADIPNNAELAATKQQLGPIEKSTLPEQAAEVVFSMNEGETSQPIQTPFGWHIFRVGKIQPGGIRSLDDVRERLTHDLMLRNNESKISDISAQLEDSLAGGSTLEEAAQPFGLKVEKLPPVTKQGKDAQGNTPQAFAQFPRMLELAFRLDEKSESPLTPADEGVYFIVRVEKVEPEHLRPLDEVRKDVVKGWEAEQRLKKLHSMADDIATQLQQAADAAKLAPTYGSLISTGKLTRTSAQMQNGKYLPPDMIDELFRLKPGKATKSYQFDGNNYAIAILRSVDANAKSADTNETKDQILEIRSSLSDTMKNELLQQYIMSLRARYDVQVNDTVLQDMMQQQ